ncbi:MAG: AAA family ATPase, partial [Bacilli bacterium]|nr:AAA family ATPase [Bacilli bacterium]
KEALYTFLYSGDKVEVYEVYLRHQNSELDYEFSEESDGTKRMFDLLDIIISPIPYAIYLIDEINRSMHPLLTEKYLTTFKKCLQENQVQLLFTTHEASLLTETLLRRDEVWFVEKQADNSSRLFSLDIFQRENESDLEKAYLSGHYGGIPLLDNSGDE